MTQLGPSPFVWLQFDEQGALTERDAALAALNAALAQPGVEDLMILSHGWKTDLGGAQALYKRLWENVIAELRSRGRDPAKIVVVGALWPSKAYNADYDGGRALSDAAHGPTLAVKSDFVENTDLPQKDFDQLLTDIEGLVGQDKAARLLAAAQRAASPGARSSEAKELFAAAHEAFGMDADHEDPELARDARLLTDAMQNELKADDLLQAFTLPVALEAPPGFGAAQGLGDVIGGVYQGLRHGVGNALNQLSYYAMKARAGVVGEALGRDVLAMVRPAAACRLHLTGHSFGARLVTAAANTFQDTDRLQLRSLTLLQGAYSHNGMTAGKGPYSAVPGKVPGPIAVTHTFNDWACSIAYPLASRLAGDRTLRLGDKNDPFGAMGANGALVPADLLAADTDERDFQPVPRKVNPFRADAYIIKTDETDAHNNVYNADCGRLVARVMIA